MNSNVTLVVPVYNESLGVNDFFEQLKGCNFNLINEIIFVNDCSTDDSSKLIEEKIIQFNKNYPNIKLLLISNLKNRGYGFSIKKGVNKSTNNYIAVIDLDKTYKIDDLNILSNQFINEYKFSYDLIAGQREISVTNTSRLKVLGKSIINKIANLCFNEKILDYNSGLRVFDKKKFMKHAHMLSDRFSLTTSMTITFLNEKYDIKFTKIKYEKRLGKSKLGFNDFFKFLYTIFSLLFYYKPSRIMVPLILPLFLAFIYFLVQDISSKNITDKTILLFNFNFLSIILLFLTDKINKIK